MAEKKYRSLIDIPVKIEMQPVQHQTNTVLTIEDLQNQIEEARKGKAKVDSKYVNYDERGHLFEYKYDYARFLENYKYIIEQSQKRKKENAERQESSENTKKYELYMEQNKLYIN